MKKKIIASILVLSCISLIACGNKDSENVGTEKNTDSAIVLDEESESDDDNEKDEASLNVASDEKDEKENPDSDENADSDNGAALEITESDSTATEYTVINNGNNFVQYGDTIYFQLVNEVGLENSGLFGEFHTSSVGPVNLYAYNSITSVTDSICTLDNYSNIMISGNKMLLNSCDSDYHNTVSIFNLDLNVIEENREGYLLSCDDIGRYVVSYVNEEVGYSLDVYEYGELKNNIPIDSFYDDIGIAGDYLFYITTDDESCMLNQIDLTNGEITELGTLPENEYTLYGEPGTFTYDEDNVYFAYDFYEGTGHFHAASFFISAGIGLDNSIEYKQAGGVDEESAARYIVEDGIMKSVAGFPNTAEIDSQQALCWYDKSGNKYVALENFGWTYLESENVMDTEIAEMVGGYIYAVRQELYRTPEDDIGWREAYKILTSDVLKIDPVTGNQETIAFCQVCP